MISTYKDALTYLYENLPMFQRIGAAAYKADLTNTIKLCDALGNPENKFKSVHVAGTNGKGSTSHMIASILQEAGYKTGLYTSPHLKSFTERIKINRRDVSEQFVVDFVNRIQPHIDEIKPSFFEITVAMAFEYFVQEKVDIAVIEVGLGGRLDSTNVITPLLSVITNIGWDHKDLLGDTLEKIATEKAGIIKTGIPIVVSQRQKDIQDVFKNTAHQKNAPLSFASDEFNVQLVGGLFDIQEQNKNIFSGLNIPLKGIYQTKNIPGVMKSVEILNELDISISPTHLKNGLENVIKNTGLKGRWQTLQEKPLMICDTGHNVDGIREVVNQISTISHQHLHIVFGVVKDKDVSDVLALLPKQATYYFCQAKLPRALPADSLAEKAKVFGLHGRVIPDVNEAKSEALKNASPDDFIFIGGSTFVVAELNEL